MRGFLLAMSAQLLMPLASAHSFVIRKWMNWLSYSIITKPLKGTLSYVMMLYDKPLIHFLMTKEWADANGIKSWADIASKKPRMRLAINRPDNPQTTIGAPYEVMKAYGFSINDIEKWGGSYVL